MTEPQTEAGRALLAKFEFPRMSARARETMVAAIEAQARDAALAEAAGRLAELRCHPNITSAGWLSFPDPNGAFVEYAAAIAALRSGGAG